MQFARRHPVLARICLRLSTLPPEVWISEGIVFLFLGVYGAMLFLGGLYSTCYAAIVLVGVGIGTAAFLEVRGQTAAALVNLTIAAGVFAHYISL